MPESVMMTGVLFWFAGLSVVIVWFVFRSGGIDYRTVMAGAVLPVVEVVVGRVFVLHTLAGGVLALAVVMVATRRRRLLRRRWIGVPIGMLLHLALDGSFADRTLFWWPVTGLRFDDAAVQELSRSPLVLAAMELSGLAALSWCVWRFGLTRPDERRAFVRSGRLVGARA